MNYVLHLIVLFDIYAIVALSLNILVGYCGLLTLAHAGYFALGAYSVALLTVVAGWAFLPAMLVGVAVAAVASLAVSLPAWRLHGDFFVLASLAVQALLYSFLDNWWHVDAPLGTWLNMTNGPRGIAGIPQPELLGWRFHSPASYAPFATAIAFVCLMISIRLLKSPWGRLLMSMREDEAVLMSLGKDTRAIKVQAFAVACGMVAVAGALYAGYFRHLQPFSFSLDVSILLLTMVIVGGVGNIRGPLFGAAILIGLPEALRFLELPEAQAANLRMLIYGFMLVGFMHWRPQGVAGTYRLQ